MHKLCGVLTCTRWASHSVRVVRRIRARIGLEEENNAEGDRQYLQFSPRVVLLLNVIVPHFHYTQEDNLATPHHSQFPETN